MDDSNPYDNGASSKVTQPSDPDHPGDIDTTDFSLSMFKVGQKKSKKSGEGQGTPEVQVYSGPDVYDLGGPRRSMALIICNDKFTKMLPRQGADKDISKIYQTMTSLGFEPHLLQNLTASQISHNFEKAASVEHSDADCFVCVLMSHGDSDGIYGTDDICVNTKEMIALFKGDKCRSLAGKPKLFFIQACRGQSVDSGVEVPDGPISFKRKKKKKMICTIPTSADFLVSCSTVDDHFAFLNSKRGSVYIQSLSDELSRCEGRTEISTVLQRVTRSVAYGFLSNTDNPDYNQKKQCPVFTSTLTKQLYLNKKSV